jgi:hypothetical protein
MIELIDFIYDSRMSLILSDTSSEHIKEYLISQFSPIDITTFSDKQMKRDMNINEATNLKQYYHLDTMMMPITKVGDGLERSKVIQHTVRRIQSYASDNNRFILSGSTYRRMANSDIRSMSMIGGQTPMYAADIVIIFNKEGDKYYYSIVKNRNGLTESDKPLIQFNREFQINKIIY